MSLITGVNGILLADFEKLKCRPLISTYPISVHVAFFPLSTDINNAMQSSSLSFLHPALILPPNNTLSSFIMESVCIYTAQPGQPTVLGKKQNTREYHSQSCLDFSNSAYKPTANCDSATATTPWMHAMCGSDMTSGSKRLFCITAM